MKMSDAELVALYDDAAKNTQIGIAFYREELARRSADLITAAMEELARKSATLSFVSVVVSVAALIVAIVTLIVTAD